MWNTCVNELPSSLLQVCVCLKDTEDRTSMHTCTYVLDVSMSKPKK